MYEMNNESERDISNDKWYSEKEIKEVIDKNLKDLYKKLANHELPDMCQANLSGAIIWLEVLKKELLGE